MKGNELLLDAIGGVDPELVLAARAMEGGSRRHGRRMLAVALAAALVLALGVTAYGYFSGAEWFKGWFAGQNGALTPAQEGYIDANAAALGQSVTVDGWTVTLQTAIADQYDFIVKLRIEAPEGTTLDEDGISGFRSETIRRADGADKGALSGASVSKQWYRETDGSFSYILSQSVTSRTFSDFSYTDGAHRTLCFTDLCKDGEVLVEGEWIFDVVFPVGGGEAIELLEEPFHCEGRRLVSAGEGKSVEEYFGMTLTSFRLTALSAAVDFEYDEAVRPADGLYPYPSLSVSVVLKDGTVVRTACAGGETNGKTGSDLFPFAAPVVLEEVDHIELTHGYTIPMPD